MLLWLLLGYLLISAVFGVLVGTAIRMQSAGSCDRPSPATAPRPVPTSTGERAGLGVQVATGS